MDNLTFDSIDPTEFISNFETKEVEYLGEFEEYSFDPSRVALYEEEIFQNENDSSVYVSVYLTIEGNDEEYDLVHLNTTLEDFKGEMEAAGYELTSNQVVEEVQEAEIINFQDFKEQRMAA